MSKDKDKDECSDGSNKVILFMATILSKMSQLFSEINFIYLNSMMNGKNMDVAQEFKLFQQIQTSLIQDKHKQDVIQDIPQRKESQEKVIQKKKEKVKDRQKDKMKVKEKEKEKEKEKQKYKQQQKQKEVQNDRPTAKPQIINTPPNPPPSSFLLFFKDHKDKIADQYPQSSIAQLSKIASQCWKQLSVEQKKIYHDRFNEQKIKYYQAIKIYNKQKQRNEEMLEKQREREKRGQKHKKQSGVPQQAIKYSQGSEDDSEIKI